MMSLALALALVQNPLHGFLYELFLSHYNIKVTLGV